MKKKTVLTALFLAAGLSLSGCLPEEETFETLPYHEQYAGPDYVTAVCEKRDIVDEITVSFKYVPVNTVSLSFPVDGLNYDKFFFEAGDTVQEGDLICQVDPGTLEKDIEDLSLQIENTLTELDDLKESRAMAVKVREKQDANLAYKDRAKDLEKLNREYDRMERDINDRLDLLNLKKETAENKLKERQIIAPFTGVITYLAKPDVGEECVLNKKVCTISDTSVLLFRSDTPHWTCFTPGDSFMVVNLKTGSEYAATAVSEEELGLEVKEKTPGKTETVYLSLKEPPLDLEEKDSGTVFITLDERHDVLSVPERAVTQINGQSVVYIIDENGLRHSKEVQAGISNSDYVEIVDGLNEGDTVIIR